MTERYPKPTVQVEAYVEAIGLDSTIEFLLHFGGAEIYLTDTPKDRSQVVKVIGYDKTVALAGVIERLPRRVPLAKPWIAAVLHAKGLSKSEIARRLRVTDVTVRGYLRDTGPRGAKGSRDPNAPVQLKLF